MWHFRKSSGLSVSRLHQINEIGAQLHGQHVRPKGIFLDGFFQGKHLGNYVIEVIAWELPLTCFYWRVNKKQKGRAEIDPASRYFSF